MLEFGFFGHVAHSFGDGAPKIDGLGDHIQGYFGLVPVGHAARSCKPGARRRHFNVRYAQPRRVHIENKLPF